MPQELFNVMKNMVTTLRGATMTPEEIVAYLKTNPTALPVIASARRKGNLTPAVLAANNFTANPTGSTFTDQLQDFGNFCRFLVVAGREFGFKVLDIDVTHVQSSTSSISFRAGSKLARADAKLVAKKGIGIRDFVRTERSNGSSLNKVARKIKQLTGVEINTGTISRF